MQVCVRKFLKCASEANENASRLLLEHIRQEVKGLGILTHQALQSFLEMVSEASDLLHAAAVSQEARVASTSVPVVPYATMRFNLF